MNTIKILFFIILLPCLSYGQKEWAPVGAKWYYSIPTELSGTNYLYILESEKDTVIASKNVRKILTKEIYLKSYKMDTIINHEFIYYDSSKVFQYDKPNNKFNLLYNFKAKQGDTITVSEDPLFKYRIDSVRKKIFCGDSLLFFYTSDLGKVKLW